MICDVKLRRIMLHCSMLQHIQLYTIISCSVPHCDYYHYDPAWGNPLQGPLRSNDHRGRNRTCRGSPYGRRDPHHLRWAIDSGTPPTVRKKQCPHTASAPRAPPTCGRLWPQRCTRRAFASAALAVAGPIALCPRGSALLRLRQALAQCHIAPNLRMADVTHYVAI